MVSSADDQTNGSQRFGDGSEGGHEHAQEHRERRGFGTDGQEQRHRRGRALIDVRRPDLEWRGGNFESEPDEHQRRRGAGQDQVDGAPPAVRSNARISTEIGGYR